MGDKRALVCAPLLPEFDRESGSQRIYDAVTFLRETGWAVSFIAQNGGGGERYARHLQQRGVATYCGFGERADRLIASGRFAVAIFAFWHLAEEHLSRVRRLSPYTRIIVDTIDLHFVRHARRLFQGARTGSGGLLDDRYANELCRELNTYAAADGVLAVSRKEADLVNDLVGDPALALLAPDAENLAFSPFTFPERRGILFLGNFRHPPNKEALRYLCHDVLPRIDTRTLAEHPLYIVGNALDNEVRDYFVGHKSVRIVGWVPSVVPYLQRSRLSVVPLLHGAGTKRKMIQTLMVGTPTVSTTVGMEGLQLKSGQHALQADDPQTFADSVARLLTDRPLWEQLAAKGREHIQALHGREVVRDLWLGAIESVLARKPKRVLPDNPDDRTQAGIQTNKVQQHMASKDYRQLRDRVKVAVQTAIPEGATVIVVSRGDPQLLELNGRTGWHFPQNEAGLYAGYYPVDSAAAINHLEDLRLEGGSYLVFPATSLWWLDHYDGFRRHLDDSYLRTFQEEGVCLLYNLQPLRQAGQKLFVDVTRDLFNEMIPTSPALGKDNGAHSANGVVIREATSYTADGHSAVLVGGVLRRPRNLAGPTTPKKGGEAQWPVSLVTGGGGFIGSHVAEHLLGMGHRVVVLDDLSGGFQDNVPVGANFVEGSILDHAMLGQLFEQHCFDYVYHLAAYAAEGLSHFVKRFNYSNNLIATVNLVNEAVKHNVKCFVFTSSIAIYGAGQTPMTEDMTPLPEDSYGIAKLACEQELRATQRMFGMDYIIFRPHNVYGERQNIADRYRNVVGIFMNQLLNGEPMTIFGDGEQQRAFTHISDIAPILAESVNVPAARNEVFNIGADVPIAVNDLARAIAKAMRTACRTKHLDARNEVTIAFSDHSKAAQIFGRRPNTSLEAGLRRMADWVKEHGARESAVFQDLEIVKNLPRVWAAAAGL